MLYNVVTIDGTNKLQESAGEGVRGSHSLQSACFTGSRRGHSCDAYAQGYRHQYAHQGQSEFEALVVGFPLGECLAPGHMAHTADQGRALPIYPTTSRSMAPTSSRSPLEQGIVAHTLLSLPVALGHVVDTYAMPMHKEIATSTLTKHSP